MMHVLCVNATVTRFGVKHCAEWLAAATIQFVRIGIQRDATEIVTAAPHHTLGSILLITSR